MSLELKDWRALALGWAAAIVAVAYFGLTWPVPVIGIVVTVAMRTLWR